MIKPRIDDVVKLLCMTHWRTSDDYWGLDSPCVNDKRPYGNSGDLVADIHEILGTEPEDYDDDGFPVFNDLQNGYAEACHRAMVEALQSIFQPKNKASVKSLIDLSFDVLGRDNMESRSAEREKGRNFFKEL